MLVRARAPTRVYVFVCAGLNGTTIAFNRTKRSADPNPTTEADSIASFPRSKINNNAATDQIQSVSSLLPASLSPHRLSDFCTSYTYLAISSLHSAQPASCLFIFDMLQRTV